MTESTAPITPVEINLHKKSRLLEIAFSDGSRFNYPYEYLRVYASEDGEQSGDDPVHGKRLVEISSIGPEGRSSLLLAFDDGCSSTYSWSRLRELGAEYEQNWNAYLQRLEAHNLSRGEGRAAGAHGKVVVKLLYFIQLTTIAGKDEEDVVLPESVVNVESLLAWLRKRGAAWNEAFATDMVQVTVNKHFAEPYTLIEHGDEVAIVPRAK